MSSSDDRGASSPAAESFEGLGIFYLGRILETTRASDGDAPLLPFLYDASDLTTHAVALGMTGSGKTGLCITLIEEAALDGIPAIAIDLKGDIANLMLTFPDLAAEDFLPWIDEAEAARLGLTPEEHAAATAEQWREGLASDGQDGARIQRLKDAVDMAIYTPGATHGRPLAVLSSFAAPSEAVQTDPDALGDRVMSAASGLLTLIGEDADPLKSREHILLSTIFEQSWLAGEDLDLAGLIRTVQEPGFDRVGVLDLDSFFPADERFELATTLNNLIAAPGFDAWLKGAPLDIGSLLWTPEGKPRVAIVSVAHLNEAERMFFLTMLFNETVAWMRSQSGTSSLRAILYIDEVFGYLPPTAKPPTKPPLLTLLKQARAFGLGVVLATQNPVDLDYKALGNAGTWFLGRLQTERDKMRVLDGLETADAMSGPSALSRKEMDGLLSDLDKRVFLVNNVHEDAPLLIRTRWAMSYLRGPLARPEIERLTAESAEGAMPGQTARETAPSAAEETGAVRPVKSAAGASTRSEGGRRPMLPPDIDEVFIEGGADGGPYRPALVGEAELHYTKRGLDLDHWTRIWCLVELGEELPPNPWGRAVELDAAPQLTETPADGAGFLPLPEGASDPDAYESFEERFESWLYRERRLRLLTCERLDLTSRPGESEAKFRLRLRDALSEGRDAAVAEMREDYGKKLERVRDRIDTAEEQALKQEAQYEASRSRKWINIGASIFSLLRGNSGRLATTARGFGSASKQRQDVELAEQEVAEREGELAALAAEMEEAVAELRKQWAPEALRIEEIDVPPRKSDISVRRVALAWLRTRADSKELAKK